MSFPQQNRRASRSKPLPALFFLFLILILGLIGVDHLTGGISRVLFAAGTPVWKAEAGAFRAVDAFFASFKDKQALERENEALRAELRSLALASLETEILRSENEALKQVLNRSEDENEYVAGAILARPNRTLYDTFVVDVGRKDGVQSGALVFGPGRVVIGTVAEVHRDSSLIELFSTAGKEVEVLLGEDAVAARATGRGGGDFEIRVPRGVAVVEGSPIASSGLEGGIIGVVQEITAPPADPFQTVLFSSPINIQTLRVVTIKL